MHIPMLMLVAPAITDFDSWPPPRATIACDAVMMMKFRVNVTTQSF